MGRVPLSLDQPGQAFFCVIACGWAPSVRAVDSIPAPQSSETPPSAAAPPRPTASRVAGSQFFIATAVSSGARPWLPGGMRPGITLWRHVEPPCQWPPRPRPRPRLASAVVRRAGPSSKSCRTQVPPSPSPRLPRPPPLGTQRLPRLDGRHQVFGRVLEGQELIEAVNRVDTDLRRRPKVPITVRAAGELHI
jgi:cyclophilin family peptidyl-prolyl cis-trans isomerase